MSNINKSQSNEVLLKNKLDMFSINLLNNIEITDINYIYRTIIYIDQLKDKRVNKEKQIKRQLKELFNILSEHFHMTKAHIIFDNIDDLSIEDSSAIYFNNLNLPPKDLVLSFTKTFIEQYLRNLYLYNIDIDNRTYKTLRLGIITNNSKIINTYSDLIMCSLYNSTDIPIKDIKINKIKNSSIEKAYNEYKQINNKYLKEAISIDLGDDLYPELIRNVFRLFASTSFDQIEVNEKIYLMNLLYNYFNYSYDDKIGYYINLINKHTSNIEALKIVENSIFLNTNDKFNKLRNKKLQEDFATGFKYVIQNDLDLDNIKKLDYLFKEKDKER